MLFLLLLMLITSDSFGQNLDLERIPYDENKLIELKLLENEVIASDKGFSLKISICNKTDANLILYRFKIIGSGVEDEKFLMKKNFSSGSELFPKDSLNRWFKLRMDGKINRVRFLRGITRDTIEKINEESKIILKARETLEMNLPVKLRQGFLQKGTYSLYMIYSCGINIKNGSDLSAILKDLQDYNAMVYLGYIKSNTIKLKVVKTHPVQRFEDYLNSN